MSTTSLCLGRWHKEPQARSIINRLRPGELRREISGVMCGVTERAQRHIERLEALRRSAIDRECGFTLGSAQHPYDQMKSEFWHVTSQDAPSVYDALSEHFVVAKAGRA